MKKNVSVKSGKARTKRLLLTVISAVILIIAAIALFWFWNVQQKEDSPKNKPEKEQEEKIVHRLTRSALQPVKQNDLEIIMDCFDDAFTINDLYN